MKKKFLLMTLLSLLTFTSCNLLGNPSNGEVESENNSQVSNLETESENNSEVSNIVSESEIENSNFPSDDIKAFFNVDDVPPSFQGDVFYTESDTTEGYECFIVYTLKNEGASIESFSSYLTNLGYEEVLYESNDDYYYVESTSTLPYFILFYEQDVDSSTYFVAQYYYDGNTGGEVGGDVNEDGYYVTSTFPDSAIKTYFGSTTSLVSFNASEYYYVETVDADGYDCFFMYSTSSSINAEGYASALNNASYTVEAYEDEEGPYYYAYNDSTGYELLFWDDSSDNSFNVQIYYYGDSSDAGGDTGEESEYESLSSFPSARIASWIGVDTYLPSYEAETYYYLEYDYYGILNVVFMYSDLSVKACNDAYYQILSNAGYTISFESDEMGDYYYAYNADAGYSVYFYEDETTFSIEVYAYFEDDDGDNVGGDTGNDSYVSSSSFPSSAIKNFFSSTSELVSYETSEVYYIETTDDYGDECFYMYSYDNSVDALGYKALLTSAGYTVEDYEDEDGPYYYAYNDSTGYELLFWDDSSDDSLNLQIYYYGESNGNNGSENNPGVEIEDSIVLNQSSFPTAYGPYTFKVDEVTFSCDYIMQSTQYSGTFQWKKNAGVLYNTTAIEGATTITIDFHSVSTGSYGLVLYVGDSEGNCTTEVTPTVNGNIYTYDITGYSYFKIENKSNACYLNSITIY